MSRAEFHPLDPWPEGTDFGFEIDDLCPHTFPMEDPIEVLEDQIAAIDWEIARARRTGGAVAIEELDKRRQELDDEFDDLCDLLLPPTPTRRPSAGMERRGGS